MANQPTAFVREGDVPYQSIPLILAAGETRQIPGTLRYVLLKDITTESKIFISFNGASFWALPSFEQLQNFESDSIWIQNTDVAPNAVTIVTGMATLNATRVVIDSTSTLNVAVTGTAAVSSVDLGAKADAAATTDAGTFSLISLFKRLLGKFDTLIKSTYSVDSLATTNAAAIAAGARRVYSASIMNTSGATKYVRLYDKLAAPTVGTDIPLRVIAVPATSSKEVAWPAGDNYALGLGIAITGAAAYNDATAVAAHDVQLTLNYN